ncbi:MAG: serine/threonine-protein kinase, partial [Actinomycetota bacterium]
MRTEQPRAVLAGRYVLEQELGRSGLGVAWRATDLVLDRRVVVKLLRPELAEDPGFADRLVERLRAVALVSHPGLARLLDTGREDGVEFIVREYVEGGSLRDLLDSERKVPADQAARVIGFVLDVLAASHDAGILHLDLKPENVLIGPDGTVRVCDPVIAQAP